MSKQAQRKAANGEGTISEDKEKKRWRAIISAGVVDGKRKRVYGMWRDTKRDARADLRQMLYDRDRGVTQRRAPLTLAQFIDQWLADVAKPTVRYSSWRAYRARLDNIKTAIGHIRLTNLTSQDVQAVLRRMTDDGYSAHAVHSTRNVLIAVLNVAEEWELVPRNVAKRTKIAPVPSIDRPVLTEPAVRQLLVAAIGTPAHIAIHLGILGLRSGEVCALLWKDVDWKEQRLAVRGTRVYAPGRTITGPTKTPRSTRTVPLPAATMEALRAWQDDQAQQRYGAGDRWQNTGALITSLYGRPMGTTTLNKYFHAALDAAGLPRMRFHDLRHSSASLMASGGVQIHARMGVLGHSDTKMALHYTHMDDDDVRAAVDVLGRVLTVEMTTE